MRVNKGFILGILITIVLGIFVYFGLTPAGRNAWNNKHYSVQKVDEKRYQSQKLVEDTCRTMIASYEADQLAYEQYKGSDDAEQRAWAEQARIRANKTASTYNEYILQNSFVWEENVPDDIRTELEVIE